MIIDWVRPNRGYGANSCDARYFSAEEANWGKYLSICGKGVKSKLAWAEAIFKFCCSVTFSSEKA